MSFARRLAICAICAICAIAAALLSRVSEAGASPGFPDVTRDKLGLKAAPLCTVCHLGADGGNAGSTQATTLFGRSLVARGLRGGDDGSLVAAIDAMQRENVDSDGDGALDLDELYWGGDPNVGEVPRGASVPPPSYGCLSIPRIAITARRPEAVVAVFVIGAIATAVFVRRRRR